MRGFVASAERSDRQLRAKAADDSLQACFIRKIKPDGSVTTVSQNLLVQSGTGINLNQSYPGSLVVDSHGQLFLTRDNGIVLLDAAGHETPVGGKASVAGEADGIGDHALFSIPAYLSIDGQDNLYVMDNYASVVRKGEFLGYLPGITSQPQSLTVAAGSSAEFSVTASSTPAPGYQWYFNGNAIGGATSSTLSIAHAGSTDAGDYTVVVTNALGTVTSGKATLTVSSVPPTASSGSHGGGSMEAWFALALAGLSLITQRRSLRQP